MSRKRRHVEQPSEYDFDDAAMFGDDFDVDTFLFEQEKHAASTRRRRRQAYRYHESRSDRRRFRDAIADWEDYD